MTGPRPMSGRQLLGWIGQQPNARTMLRRVERLGRSRGYPSLILKWSADQVADVFHELREKAAKGSSQWGGSARSGGSTAR